MTTNELGRLRQEVRTWLGENVPPDLEIPKKATDMSDDLVRWTLDFYKKLGAQRWLGPDWPTYFGGGGYSPSESQAIRQELQSIPLPKLPLDPMWLIPLRAYGTEEQKGEWLSKTLLGEITVMHAITEPRGGSDLAGQTTRAIKDGDGYMVTGEKGYIHGPYVPDYLFMVVTTDPDGPKYENLSTVILDTHSEGIKFVKGSMNFMGNTDSNAILENVWLPADRIVGGEGNGWEVALCMIDVERGFPGVTPEQRDLIEKREREYWG